LEACQPRSQSGKCSLKLAIGSHKALAFTNTIANIVELPVLDLAQAIGPSGPGGASRVPATYCIDATASIPLARPRLQVFGRKSIRSGRRGGLPGSGRRRRAWGRAWACRPARAQRGHRYAAFLQRHAKCSERAYKRSQYCYFGPEVPLVISHRTTLLAVLDRGEAFHLSGPE
jgi:hypothetical protein